MDLNQETIEQGCEFKPRKLRGISLFEAMLGLMLAATVTTSMLVTQAKYAESQTSRASGKSLLNVAEAVSEFTDHHFENMLKNTSSNCGAAGFCRYELSDTASSRFLSFAGEDISNTLGVLPSFDAFGMSYEVFTRRVQYNRTTGAGTTPVDSLHVLILTRKNDPGNPLNIDPTLKISAAGAVGRQGGYVTEGDVLCTDNSGGVLPEGTVCGNFGSWSIDPTLYTEIPDIELYATAAFFVRGDSTVYGDQLYRMDYGDPELNTMRTDLILSQGNANLEVNENTIRGARRIEGTGDGNAADDTDELVIAQRSGRININADEEIHLAGDHVRIATDNGLVIDQGTGGLAGLSRITAAGSTMDLKSSTGRYGFRSANDTLAELRFGNDGTTVLSNANAKFRINGTDAVPAEIDTNSNYLRLDANDSVVVGAEGFYQAGGPGGPIYGTGDGLLRVGRIIAQDIEIADAGGSIGGIMPRWRHMGVYPFESASDAGSGQRQATVPYPDCGSSRFDGGRDGRLVPRILVNMASMFTTQKNADMAVEMYAQELPTGWRVYAIDVSSTTHQDRYDPDKSYQIRGTANTYCYFDVEENPAAQVEGPEAPDPNAGSSFTARRPNR